MAYCSNCGEKLNEGVKFCSSCGKPVSVESSSEEKRKTVYDGAIHKCTNCGEVLPSFVLKCPSCGCEIRDSKSSKVIEEFSKKLSECETINKTIQLIRTFPIPNTKEDLFEFLVVAKTNMKRYDKNGDGVISESEEELLNAWLTKVEQCVEKAKILIDNTKDLEIFEKAKEEIKVVNNEIASVKQQVKNEKVSYSLKEEFKKSKGSKIAIIVGIVLSFLWIAVGFTNRRILAGIVAILSMGSFISAFLIGHQVIKIRIRKIYILPIIIGYVLFISYLLLCNLKNYGTVNWTEIELKDYVPNLDKKGNVEENTETSLHIEFIGLSQSDHNQILKDVKAMGYTNVKFTNSVYYNAYNDEEYYLEVWWSEYSGTIDFYLDAPIEMSIINWDNIVLKDSFPTLIFNEGVIEKNTNTDLNMIVDDVSYEEYLQFINQSKQMGYTIDIKESEQYREYNYEVFNTNGTKMVINYNECIKDFEIIIISPETYVEIVWPNSSIVKTLPKPKSNIGKITANSDTHFCIKVANTTFAEFQAYVNECMENGYDEDYYWWDDDYYSADKGDYDLTVKYLGGNVIEINLYYWG